MLPVIFFRNRIANMIYNRKLFMKIDKENQPDLHQKITKLYYIGYTLSRCYFCLLWETAISYCLKPIMIRELFIIMWVPDVPYAFEIILAGQYFYAPVLVSIVFGMDILFLSLCIDITAQFKILGYNLMHLEKNSMVRNTTLKEELNRCIDHHAFLIRYVSDMEHVYTLTLLGEYVIAIGSFCTDLYTMQDSTQLNNTRLASLMYSMATLSQFALYCFAANMLTTEMSKISRYFYSCGWENFNTHLQKLILISVIFSQKEIELKGGKMVKINRETFAFVLKTAFSLLTLMRSMN